MQPDRAKIATRAGWVSILTNVLLFGLKYWAGIVSGSVAIVADAWHTLSDSVSSVALIVGVRMAQKPADREHPFGHGRAEMLAAIIIGAILAVIGVEFGMESIRRIVNREAAEYGTIAILVTVISIFTKEGIARYSIRAGKRSGAQALRADAWHHRSDAISSVVILAGIFLNKYAWWIDGVLGILVALLILSATYGILKDVFNPLLGERPKKEVIDRVMEICRENIETEVYPHHIHVHKYGHHTEMTLHIKLSKQISLEKAHNVASVIEDTIRDEMKIETTIHMEPRSGRIRAGENKQ